MPAGTTLGTITSLAVNANAKNKEAALDLMKFVTGPEGAAVIASTGTIPAIMNDEDGIYFINGWIPNRRCK